MWWKRQIQPRPPIQRTNRLHPCQQQSKKTVRKSLTTVSFIRDIYWRGR